MTKTRWGHDFVWVNNDQYSSAIMVIEEGQQTAYYYHKRRDKTILILQGTAQIILEGKTILLNAYETYHFPPQIIHRVRAIKGDLTIIEVGTKSEDDIVVVEK